MRSSHHGPYDQGNTRATMAHTKGRKTARWSKSQKVCLNSDCRLQFAYMKLESLVNADKGAALNTFSGLVHTARHTMKARNTQSPDLSG